MRAPLIQIGALALVFALGWVASDAWAWWRARRGTGKATIHDEDAAKQRGEFPSRHIRRKAAKQMTRRLFRQASAHGRYGIKPRGVID